MNNSQRKTLIFHIWLDIMYAHWNVNRYSIVLLHVNCELILMVHYLLILHGEEEVEITTTVVDMSTQKQFATENRHCGSYYYSSLC